MMRSDKLKIMYLLLIAVLLPFLFIASGFYFINHNVRGLWAMLIIVFFILYFTWRYSGKSIEWKNFLITIGIAFIVLSLPHFIDSYIEAESAKKGLEHYMDGGSGTLEHVKSIRAEKERWENERLQAFSIMTLGGLLVGIGVGFNTKRDAANIKV